MENKRRRCALSSQGHFHKLKTATTLNLDQIIGRLHHQIRRPDYQTLRKHVFSKHFPQYLISKKLSLASCLETCEVRDKKLRHIKFILSVLFFFNCTTCSNTSNLETSFAHSLSLMVIFVSVQLRYQICS